MIAHNPLHRSQRAGLPHWALASGDDAKSPQGIGMSNARRGQPAPDEPPHPLPGDTGCLAPPPQRAVPKSPHLETERVQRRAVHRHPVVPQMPLHDRAQPPAHLRDGSVQTSLQLGFHRAELCLQPLPDRLPHHREPSIPLLPANVREAEEVERLRLPFADAPPVLGRERTELQQPRRSAVPGWTSRSARAARPGTARHPPGAETPRRSRPHTARRSRRHGPASSSTAEPRGRTRNVPWLESEIRRRLRHDEIRPTSPTWQPRPSRQERAVSGTVDDC